MHPSLCKEYFLRQAEQLHGSPVLTALGIRVLYIGDMFIDLAVYHLADRIHCLMRLDCRNFDYEPPLADLIDPATKQHLQDCFWPNSSVEHSFYGRAFCVSRTRGYHDHEGHQDDVPYYLIRNSLTLEVVISDVYAKLNKGSFPIGGPYHGWNPDTYL